MRDNKYIVKKRITLTYEINDSAYASDDGEAMSLVESNTDIMELEDIWNKPDTMKVEAISVHKI